MLFGDPGNLLNQQLSRDEVNRKVSTRGYADRCVQIEKKGMEPRPQPDPMHPFAICPVYAGKAKLNVHISIVRSVTATVQK